MKTDMLLDRAGSSAGNPLTDAMRKTIQEELDAILTSSSFHGAERCKQFLAYVVHHQVEGRPELLKERTIGTEVFQRQPGYATGEDPVVRVQAGKVRHRLEQFYQVRADKPKVRIELPLGSYSPLFQWAAPAALPESVPSAEEKSVQEPVRRTFWSRRAVIGCISVGLLLFFGIISVVFVVARQNERRKTAMDVFWAPIFASQQPVLICLAQPIVYRPSQQLYRQYASSHDGAFHTEVERTNVPLPLKQSDKINWGDMYLARDYGVAVGDAYAAVDLSGTLGRLGKPSQVRIGTGYSFEDLRNSPAVLVGAFNNSWTMQLAPNLHYNFIEDHEDFSIRASAPSKNVWRVRFDANGGVIGDYALIGRVLDSKTGQFTIIVAGITGAGTRAAGDLVSNPAALELALRGLPAGWQSKNLELVLETTVTDSIPGPAHVVASYSW
jgi:hypothetical protein